MKIQMADATDQITWTVEQCSAECFVAIQVDRMGSHVVEFASADEAATWTIEQARFAHTDMGFKFVV